ncbi:hypothetical protein H4R24_000889 [Coemansia sp. RSA 988]|nr:hypothetical protein H4R24_000889 [Coemansia sp. RSA 988]
MEVDQSPEDYFHQHAAAALLRSDAEDLTEDLKESWSGIEDASGSEDELSVISKKRILRYGRKRLSEMQARFDAAKTRLYEEKQQQLDLEWTQLQNGSHPQYKILIEQADARWTDRLDKMEFKLKCGRELAQKNLDCTRRSANATLITRQGSLRRRMAYGRKRKLWALTDTLRGLERVSETIANISCPLSNQGALDTPVKGVIAGRDSNHLLEMPETRLPKIDEDADVSAICGIPALLNHSDSELAVPDAAAVPAPVPTADGADTKVPGYPRTTQHVYSYAVDESAYNEQAAAAAPNDRYVHGAVHNYHHAYADHYSSHHHSTTTPANDHAYYTGTSAYYAHSQQQQPQNYYNADELQANGVAVVHAPPTNAHQYKTPASNNSAAVGAHHRQHVADPSHALHRHSASQSRVADLLTDSSRAPPAPAAYQASAYYDERAAAAPPVTPGSASARQLHGSSSGKRGVATEYDATPSKRQRMAQQSVTWPSSSSAYQHEAHAHVTPRQSQDARSLGAANGRGTDPSDTVPQVYSYAQQSAAHYSHPHQTQAEYGYHASQGYYDSSKYDYASYYQQQQQSAQASAPAHSAHYRGSDGSYYYQQQQPVPQQHQPAAYPATYATDYRANGSSYSGLDTGIAMPPPMSPSPYTSRYMQPGSAAPGTWNDYYQQQQPQQQQHGQTVQYTQPTTVVSGHTVASKAQQQQQYYQQQQQQAPQTGRSYYENSAYYNTPQHQSRTVAEAGGGDGHRQFPAS